MTAQPTAQMLLVEQSGDVTVVRFRAPVTLSGHKTDQAGQELQRLVAAGHTRLVLNFANVHLLTSSMIAKVITLHKSLQAAGGRLALCALNETLREIFEVTQLPRILNLYPEEQEAVQSFATT
jgi:anti-sigma B factor antagonist